MAMSKPPQMMIVRRAHTSKGGVDRRRRVGAITPPPAPVFSDHTHEIAGLYRVADDAQNRYELYLGVDALPDFTAAPAATSTTLPFTHAVVPPGAGTDILSSTVRKRNEYGVLSLNQYVKGRHEIDTSGNLVIPGPSAATSLEAINVQALKVTIKGDYAYRDDDPSYGGDTWHLYIRTDGSDPVPATDTPVALAMSRNRATERLHYNQGPYAVSTDVRVIVRVYRSSDGVDDGSTTVTQVTVPAGPSSPTNGETF